MSAPPDTHSGSLVPKDNFVELHHRGCACGGFAGIAAWDSTRRPCEYGAGPAIGIVVDTRQWRELGSPRSEEVFRESLAVGTEAQQG